MSRAEQFFKNPLTLAVTYYHGQGWAGVVFKGDQEVFRTTGRRSMQDAALAALAHAEQFTQEEMKG